MVEIDDLEGCCIESLNEFSEGFILLLDVDQCIRTLPLPPTTDEVGDKLMAELLKRVDVAWAEPKELEPGGLTQGHQECPA